MISHTILCQRKLGEKSSKNTKLVVSVLSGALGVSNPVEFFVHDAFFVWLGVVLGCVWEIGCSVVCRQSNTLLNSNSLFVVAQIKLQSYKH
jgi:hypothetical protein